jgi:hypothetical protein
MSPRNVTDQWSVYKTSGRYGVCRGWFTAAGVRFQLSEVGELSLIYNVLDIAGVAGLSLIGHTAQPHSRFDEALRLLAS